MSGPHDFFAVARAGELVKVEPSTRLAEIAVPRELRTPDGLKCIPCAAVEVVQYAEVG